MSFNDGPALYASDISNLEYKTIDLLILEGCNAGHLDNKSDNPAANFAKIVNGRKVIASDGTVYYPFGYLLGESVSICDRSFKNQRSPGSTRDNEGFLVYKYINGQLYVSEFLGTNKIGKITTIKEIIGYAEDAK